MTNPRWLKDLGVSNMSAVSALLFVTLKETHYHSNHTHTRFPSQRKCCHQFANGRIWGLTWEVCVCERERQRETHTLPHSIADTLWAYLGSHTLTEQHTTPGINMGSVCDVYV